LSGEVDFQGKGIFTMISSCRGCFWKAGMVSVFFLWKAVSAQEVEFEKNVFTAESGFTMPYRFVNPLNHTMTKSYPLVLFLHGGGDVGTDNEQQLNWFPYGLVDSSNRVNYPCYIIAPQCPSLDTGWSSFPYYPDVETPFEPPLAITTVLELIDSLCADKSLNIDTNRIYVMGFSFGAEGTFDILTRRPQLFAAAVPISGIGDTAKVYLYKDVPLWVFHGSADSINYVKYSRMIVEKLQSLGVKTKYTEYDMDHYIPPLVYGEPELFPWLFAQNKHGQNKVMPPQKQGETGSARYSAKRNGDRVELAWNLSVTPDAAEIYTINGRMLHRYPIEGRNVFAISLPRTCAQGVLFVKLVKSGLTLHADIIPTVRY
jgi:predicted esterase